MRAISGGKRNIAAISVGFRKRVGTLIFSGSLKTALPYPVIRNAALCRVVLMSVRFQAARGTERMGSVYHPIFTKKRSTKKLYRFLETFAKPQI